MMKTICGSNQLLVQGEICITKTKDILKYYHHLSEKQISQKKKQNMLDVPNDLMLVYSLLNHKGKTFDQLCSESDLPSHIILSLLTKLEMQGLIIQSSENTFCIQ